MADSRDVPTASFLNNLKVEVLAVKAIESLCKLIFVAIGFQILIWVLKYFFPIGALTTLMKPNGYCLGIEALGTCSYDPTHPIVYFSLGQLISVLALIATLSQLNKPIVQFRLGASVVPRYAYFLAIIFAILCIFIASLLPFVPGPSVPLIGYPVFWELIASVVFVIGAIVYLSAITVNPRFSRFNAERYMYACIWLISSGSDEDLRELADAVEPNLGSVFDYCDQYKLVNGIPVKENPSKVASIAYTILQTLPDRRFCNVIVRRCPATMQAAFDEAKRIGGDSRKIGSVWVFCG